MSTLDLTTWNHPSPRMTPFHGEFKTFCVDFRIDYIESPTSPLPQIQTFSCRTSDFNFAQSTPLSNGRLPSHILNTLQTWSCFLQVVISKFPDLDVNLRKTLARNYTEIWSHHLEIGTLHINVFMQDIPKQSKVWNIEERKT